MTRVLAYDLGGSSLRVAIVSVEQGLLSSVRIPMRIPKGRNGEYEVDPAEWWNALLHGCRALQDKGSDLASVEAIAGCGFTRTQVCLDQSGQVAHPAITFQDARGTRALADYLARAAPDLSARYDELSPFHPVARLLWLRTRKPKVWSSIHHVLEPKDYINFRLTGQITSDRISQNAFRSFFAALSGDSQSSKALGFDDSVLPEAVSPFDDIGRVRTNLPDLPALSGKPVFCGSTDTWTSVLGSGALTPGVAYCISGTSDVSGILTSQRHQAQGLLTVRWGPDLWQLGGPSQGAATRLDWAVARFAPDEDVVSALKSSLPGSAATPIFLPFLEGERTPYWDNNLRGAFLGLDASHTNAAFIRAVAEAINFLSREVLQRAEAAAGVKARHICFAGGLSNNHLLCQLKADATNRPVFVAQHQESGLIGAACLPNNRADQLTEISDRIMASGSWFHPDPSRRTEMDARFNAFRRAIDALRPFSQALLEPAQHQEESS